MSHERHDERALLTPNRILFLGVALFTATILMIGSVSRAEDDTASKKTGTDAQKEAPVAPSKDEASADQEESATPPSETPSSAKSDSEKKSSEKQSSAQKDSAAPKKETSSEPEAEAELRTLPKSASEQNLVNREVYVYKTIGRRDPFASLLEGEFETTVGHPLLDVSSMRLVGVVWGKNDKFALIEDGRGHGHILRVGDPVINGYVVGLTQDELLIRQSSYGESQTVTIQLQQKEGGSDAP